MASVLNIATSHDCRLSLRLTGRRRTPQIGGARPPRRLRRTGTYRSVEPLPELAVLQLGPTDDHLVRRVLLIAQHPIAHAADFARRSDDRVDVGARLGACPLVTRSDHVTPSSLLSHSK